MIRKSGTAKTRHALEGSAAKTIYVSEFSAENQSIHKQNVPSVDNSRLTMSRQINYYAGQIRQCKQQAQILVEDMSARLLNKDERIRELQKLLQEERAICRSYKFKYHETQIQLREKQQEKQKIERALHMALNRNQILQSTGYLDIFQVEYKYGRKLQELADKITAMQLSGWKGKRDWQGDEAADCSCDKNDTTRA